MRRAKLAVAGACLLLPLGAAATSLAGADGAARVKVSLNEMKIVSTPNQVPAGKVTFTAKNTGTIEHEVVVVRRPQSGNLPVRGYKASEHGLDVGEIEGIMPGKSKSMTLTLKPGRYILICNIVGHYQLGMRTGLVAK
jgi:uncharacterized cupredoxin-like copper-binding protein